MLSAPFKIFNSFEQDWQIFNSFEQDWQIFNSFEQDLHEQFENQLTQCIVYPDQLDWVQDSLWKYHYQNSMHTC